MHLHPDLILDIHHSRTDRFRRRPRPEPERPAPARPAVPADRDRR
jgi:hypothetical protein